MCGIIGGFSKRGFTTNELTGFAAGLEGMKSRGPDSEGSEIFSIDSKGMFQHRSGGRFHNKTRTGEILLGHRRLSIIDLSTAGHQPMANFTGDIWITYNGEVYNYLELRHELEGLGHTFNTHTDTEVIIRAYEEWGGECFSRFNGMWGLAILDLREQILILSRDRFGVKPLYYVQTEKAFFFASTISAVLRFSGIERLARKDMVRDFLLFGLQPTGGDTYFEGVSQAPKGGTISVKFNAGRINAQVANWWEIEPAAISETDAVDQWRETFENAVRLRMRSDVPVGTCLSGGVDSTAITAYMNRVAPGQEIHTFTSCYTDARWDERKYVELMLQRINGVPTWIYPERESMTADLADLHRIQEQPIPTLSIYNQYCVMRAAKSAGVTVLLDGQGADEIFMGYDVCQTIYLVSLLRQGHIGDFFQHLRSLSRNRVSMGLAQTVRKLVYMGLPIVRRQVNKRRVGGLMREELLRDAGPGSFGSATESLYDLSAARKGWLEVNPLPGLLHYEDRNSMAFSIETRLPYLDYRMVNLAFGLSAEAMLAGGWPKLVSRKAIENLVPREIVWRKDKMGFPAPTSSFIFRRREMFARLIEEGCRSKELIDSDVLAAMLRSGAKDSRLWRFISLELWMRELEVEVVS